MKLRRVMPVVSFAWGAFRLYRRARRAMKIRSHVARRVVRGRLARMQ